VQIHQVLASASPADAITDSALRTRALLRRIGPSEIYALHVHADQQGDIRYLHQYPTLAERDGERNVLVFHASIGQPQVISFLMHHGMRHGDLIVVDYHNITPSAYFEQHDPDFAHLLVSGRSELRFLRDKVTLALADSAYNAAELVAMGFPDVRVSPLILDIGARAEETVDEETAAGLDTWLDGAPMLLFVGQILPHKRPDLLLQAYHLLVTHLVPEAGLVLAGVGRLDRYLAQVKLLARELGLHRARFTGHLSSTELLACWRRADAFVTASEHEGFCMPLVEAMSHHVPVVARRCAAIPETVDDAALLVDADAGPELLAEAMAEVLANGALRSHLDRRAADRLQAFDPDRSSETFLRHLLSVV
jgi:glycosyltransferase involved in cell wall biosynthesis